MRRFLAVLCLTLVPLAAFAAEEAKETPKDASKDTKGGTVGTNVAMDTLLAPLTGADGKLIAYAYISARLTATSPGIVVSVREKQPFIQDSFVRNVNAKSVVTGTDPLAVNVAALEARMLEDATRIMGKGKVKGITVCTINLAELHPTQTPSRAPSDAQQALDAHQNPLKSRCETEKPA